MPPPGLTVGKVPVQPESLGTGLQIQRLTAWHEQDPNRMRNSVPGAGLHRRGIFSEGIIELIDPVPVRHRLANQLTGQPQSRSCRASGFGVFLKARMPRVETRDPEHNERARQQRDNSQNGNLEPLHPEDAPPALHSLLLAWSATRAPRKILTMP